MKIKIGGIEKEVELRNPEVRHKRRVLELRAQFTKRGLPIKAKIDLGNKDIDLAEVEFLSNYPLIYDDLILSILAELSDPGEIKPEDFARMDTESLIRIEKWLDKMFGLAEDKESEDFTKTSGLPPS